MTTLIPYMILPAMENFAATSTGVNHKTSSQIAPMEGAASSNDTFIPSSLHRDEFGELSAPQLKEIIAEAPDIGSPSHGSSRFWSRSVDIIKNHFLTPYQYLIDKWRVEHAPSALLNLKRGDSALVLLSGGIDSAVALYLALSKGCKVVALEFDYEQRIPGEDARVKLLAAAAGVPLLRISYPKVLAHDSRDSPLKIGESNLIYYSLAAAVAKELGYSGVVGGQIFSDWSSCNLPCALPTHFKSINSTLSREYGAGAPRVLMPFLYLDKRSVVRLGIDLNVPLDLTWSCEKSGESPCNGCAQCQLRNDAINSQQRRE